MHPSNFCEQFEQRQNFASTFKLNETILYPSKGLRGISPDEKNMDAQYASNVNLVPRVSLLPSPGGGEHASEAKFCHKFNQSGDAQCCEC